MCDRRRFIAATASALPALLHAAPAKFTRLSRAFADLEKANGGRIGVAVLDTASGERLAYHADERFPMCSTFKFLLATAVLKRVDRGEEKLARAVAIPRKPLVLHSPLTEPHAGGAMTISALCHAMLTQSDNTAANLLLETIGGTAAYTAFARSIGDNVTRLDRVEPEMNASAPGDPRDTTSPAAMAANLQSVLLGNVLAPASRAQLIEWMEANETGLTRIRAKLPAGWRAADKTGSDGNHTNNDIAVFWPAGRPPVIVAAYITRCAGPDKKRSAMLAEIARLVRESLQ
jgi:beta-lactamase class A